MSVENEKAAGESEFVSRKDFARYRRDVWLFLLGVLMVSGVANISVAVGQVKSGGFIHLAAGICLFIWAWRGYK